jgi:hypothetical protein
MAGWRRSGLLLRRGSRAATREALHSLLDTDDVPLDLFQVQPSGDDLIISDLE